MKIKHALLTGICCLATLMSTAVYAADQKPNILVIWGDDIGGDNISVYSHGMMGYKTPNIDRLANEGALFTDYYAHQSCTAGRSSFILGQHPFRTGLLTIGMPGSDHGIPDWAPTIGDLLKEHGYVTGQFGKNHLGDQDKHLPTNHGFDEFFGNLYHLNAEEEPETYYYPKDHEFHKKYGPRGVIKATADGKIEDTGPMTRKRMETADDEFTQAGLDFIERAHKTGKPFFAWVNASRMHIHTRLKPGLEGTTGVSIYADGMVEHDGHIGQLLDKLDQLGIADNTIVIYSTDNGAETFTWPDGGTTRFKEGKGTTWEGGMRVPAVVRWPGVLKKGTIINDIMSHEDWMPTLLAAVGEPDIVEKLKNGHNANGKKWKVHLDGYNFLPYFKGEVSDGPREEILYFGQGGELNAIRWKDWKLSFALLHGNMATAVREIPAWPEIVNLRADPYEKAPHESGMYLRWMIDNMWLFVPIAERATTFLQSIPQYPYQEGAAFNLANISYKTFKVQEAMQQLKRLETLSPQ
ncbi:MAG: arylsulfatase [Thermodesulfobacteriota bacterium]|nr:arylsulfatase [Thermodesulfobacteriota bacterium]